MIRRALQHAVLALSLVGVVLAAGCKNKDEPQPVPVAPTPTAPGTAAPTEAPSANLAMAGSLVAASGVPASAVPPCTSCHGQQGEGNAAAGFPRLAGQSAQYLLRQLELYADGTRKNPVMMPIAHGLSDDQRKSVAAYYATQAAPATAPTAAADAKALQRGQKLSQIGDEASHVQACGNCHGPDGLGAPPSYPYLAGQNAMYLSASLKAWKDGSRDTDASRQMPEIAKGLGDEDIAALSQFFAAQAPPAPLDWKRGAPPTGTATPSGPSGASPPAEGSGSEQGSAVTGGGQGPGSGGDASKTPPPK